jgi:hypothetical protein
MTPQRKWSGLKSVMKTAMRKYAPGIPPSY